ncbi:MAG: glycosyl hydrolase family 18 protein [Flavitalea sp.]
MKSKITLFMISFCLINIIFTEPVLAQKKAVIAYFSGSAEQLDDIDPVKITHIIYCFGHLEGKRLRIASAADSALIEKMVGLKSKNPSLKVMVSLGGWGGCEHCSDVFSDESGRLSFAASVKSLNDYLKVDGIDLDWEYPAIEGYPGHKYSPSDKNNFTLLVAQLRKTLGKRQVITFAAGGFQKFLDESIDWKAVMKNVDYVNLMTYDLINGYSTSTGHHTALYSNPKQKESTNNCVMALLGKGVDPARMIIGAAFYGRMWENVSSADNGLYQQGKFKSFVPYNQFPELITKDKGFSFYWDDRSKAPYAYNASAKQFVTYDDSRSMALKTEYMISAKLGGIMFWELSIDSKTNGLLDTINKTLAASKNK